MLKMINTKYHGIYITYEEGFDWMLENSNGYETISLDHKPSEQEIDDYRDMLCDSHGI